MLALASQISSFPAWAIASAVRPFSRQPQLIPELAFNSNLSGCSVRLSAQRSSAGRVSCKASSTEIDNEKKVLLKQKAKEMVDDLRGTCIYLVGMIGSGKTTVGERLAEALGYYFFDSNKLIEQAAGGRSAPQLIEEGDEESFRDVETEVLKQLSCMGRLVVATGGGTVLRPVNWSYLRHGVTVWLDVPVETLAQRVASVSSLSEPLPTNSQDIEELAKILNDRGPFYADADATVSLQKLAAKLGYVDVNTISAEVIALEVLEEIDKLIKSRRR